MRLSISQVHVREVQAGMVCREALRLARRVQRSIPPTACNLHGPVTLLLIAMALHSTSVAAQAQKGALISSPAPLTNSTRPTSRPARNIAPRKAALPKADTQASSLQSLANS